MATAPDATPVVIPPEVAEVLLCGAMMHLGSRDSALTPECETASGARFDPGSDRILVYLPTARADSTLANLRDNGRAALTICRVTDNVSIQLKGRFLGARPGEAADRRYLEWLLDRRQRELAEVGMPRSYSSRLVWWPCVAIEIQVEEIFDQTPGPRAGEPLPLPEA